MVIYRGGALFLFLPESRVGIGAQVDSVKIDPGIGIFRNVKFCGSLKEALLRFAFSANKKIENDNSLYRFVLGAQRELCCNDFKLF